MSRIALLLVVLLAACGPGVAPPAPAGGAAEHVAPAVDGGAVEAGYRERLRLGLGGPFRLIEHALVDARLDPDTRRRLAAELLAAVEEGAFFVPDPILLAPSSGDLQSGARHLDLVTRTVEGAADPRAGEMTVRLGYRLAVLEGTVESRTASAAVRVASLARDRELARRDARRLRLAARAAGQDPLDLLPAWRRARGFQAEAPSLQELAPGLEASAIEAVGTLNSALRTLWLRAPERLADPSLPETQRLALARLSASGDTLGGLPHATLVATLRQSVDRIPEWLPDEAAASWRHFAEVAGTEEAFASRYAALVEREPALRSIAAANALRVAVGLRAYAQERPWSPGDPRVDPEGLRERHGVLVRIAEDVPEGWRAPTLSALDAALGELRELLPSVSLLGLRIEVTRESSIEGALASHSPGERVLEWPVATGAGTLAHEIAHDLDWQSARRAEIRSHGYASSRAAASRRGAFAAALAVLTPDAVGSGHATRPPEVLARGFEWFVLTQMAGRGHWNGVLSSAQDDLLTGHGSLVAPPVSEAYGPALIQALRPLVTIDEEQRRGFLARYGPDRWPRGSLILRSMESRLERGRTDRAGWSGAEEPLGRMDAVARARDAELAALAQLLCPGPVDLVDPRLATGYRGLVAAAAAAEGRSIALSLAAGVAGEAGRGWMLRALYGPLWPGAEVDPAVEPLLGEVASRADALAAPAPPLIRAGSAFGISPRGCGG